MDKLKRIGCILLATLLVFGLGYGAGRFAHPAKVVVTEKKIENDKKDTEQKKDVQAEQKKSEVVATKRKQRRHVEIDRKEIIHPDGSKEITTKTTSDTGTTDTKRDTSKIDTTLHTQEDLKSKEEHSITTEKKTETTYSRPGWRVSALVGLDVGAVGRQGLSLSLAAPKIVFGAKVERRLFWNVWAGPWALSSGQAGASASLEF
jgi:hypothetical protein